MKLKLKINKIFLIALVLTIINTLSTYAQRYEKYRTGIVKIRVTATDRPEETGSGIIISTNQTQLFILTALHVIVDINSETLEDVKKKNIQIKFRTSPEWVDAAFLFESFEEELDIALLKVDINPFIHKEVKASLKLGNIHKLVIDQPLHIIGHPQDIDWKIGTGELKKKEVNYLRFSGGIADRGNSGGALFDKKYNLVGIVRQIDPDYGTAVNIGVAKEQIENWQVPFDLKQRKVSYWGYAAGVSGISGITFKILSDSKYRQYQDATSNEDADRLKKQVQTFDVIYPIALGASAVCLATYLLSSREKGKRKNKVRASLVPIEQGGTIYFSMDF